LFHAVTGSIVTYEISPSPTERFSSVLLSFIEDTLFEGSVITSGLTVVTGAVVGGTAVVVGGTAVVVGGAAVVAGGAAVVFGGAAVVLG
jgi:hypothetical protein